MAIELLLVVLWFNPLLWVLRHKMILNHEFLADEGVLRQGIDPRTYQETLLGYTQNNPVQNDFGFHFIHYSSTRPAFLGKSVVLGSRFGQVKKRLTIMTKQTSRTHRVIRAAFFVPLTALLVLAFSEAKVIPISDESQDVKDLEAISITMDKDQNPFYLGIPLDLENIGEDLKKRLPRSLEIDSVQVSIRSGRTLDYAAVTKVVSLLNQAGFTRVIKVTAQEVVMEKDAYSENVDPKTANVQLEMQTLRFGDVAAVKASDLEIQRYNSLAKKYNTPPGSDRKIPFKDLKALEAIFGKMSQTQRQKAEPFPGSTIPKEGHPLSDPKMNGALMFGPRFPPVPLTNHAKFLKELADLGAIFYIGPHTYSAEEVIELIEKSAVKINIDTSHYPYVVLRFGGGC